MSAPSIHFPKKVMILGDSQSLPRGKSWGNLAVESTYPWRLQDILKERLGSAAPVVIERGRRSRTIEDVLSDWEEQVTLKKPDIVILNVGGADCTPRVLGRRHQKFWEVFPIPAIGNHILGLEYRYRRQWLSTFSGRPHVPLTRFRKCVDEVVKLATDSGVRHLFLMNVMPISDKLEYLWPGLTKNAALYNQCLQEFDGAGTASVVDFHGLVTHWGGPDRITMDSMHMRPEGQRLLAEELARLILARCGLEHTVPREMDQKNPRELRS